MNLQKMSITELIDQLPAHSDADMLNAFTVGFSKKGVLTEILSQLESQQETPEAWAYVLKGTLDSRPHVAKTCKLICLLERQADEWFSWSSKIWQSLQTGNFENQSVFYKYWWEHSRYLTDALGVIEIDLMPEWHGEISLPHIESAPGFSDKELKMMAMLTKLMGKVILLLNEQLAQHSILWIDELGKELSLPEEELAKIWSFLLAHALSQPLQDAAKIRLLQLCTTHPAVAKAEQLGVA